MPAKHFVQFAIDEEIGGCRSDDQKEADPERPLHDFTHRLSFRYPAQSGHCQDWDMQIYLDDVKMGR